MNTSVFTDNCQCFGENCYKKKLSHLHNFCTKPQKSFFNSIAFHFTFFSLFLFFLRGGGVCATAYLAVLPTIVRYYARNRFVHTWLVSNHHVIKYAQLKTRGKQKQTLPFSMKICTDIRPRTLFVLKWEQVSEIKAWGKLLPLGKW